MKPDNGSGFTIRAETTIVFSFPYNQTDILYYHLHRALQVYFENNALAQNKNNSCKYFLGVVKTTPSMEVQKFF